MTAHGYVELSRAVAERVAAGAMPAGTVLPSVRDLAREHGTTAATAARALARLAEAGVVTRAERRRAAVAPRGEAAARTLLRGARAFRLAGSDDPALDVVLGAVGDAVARVGPGGSFAGLLALWRGEADGAAIHLPHPAGDGNAPYARSVLRGRSPTLVHLWRREQGLLVAPGDPLGIATVAGLAGRRVARREQGAGTRVLLDRLLLDAGIDPYAVRGPELRSHLEVGLAVASGVADAGLGVRSAAAAAGVDFLPVTTEAYDVVLPGDALGDAEPLVAALGLAPVRAAITALGGYDVTRAGEVVRLER